MSSGIADNLAYEFLGDYASAMAAYLSANMWREALSCAGALQLTGRDLTDLASDLADEMEEAKDHQGAARVCLDYLSDVERCAGLLCKANQFKEAIRLVVLHDKMPLLETVVDAGLVEAFNSTTELLADCRRQIGAQVPRLRELRVKKLQEPLAFYAGDASAAAGDDIPDDISLAPTETSTAGGTLLTRYTGHTNGTLNTQTTRRTSKNRRREERKRARGKKGSVYEEEYLVNSFGRLVERVNSIHEDVAQLIEGLARRRKLEQARAIEQAMTGLIGFCRDVAGEVSGDQTAAERVSEEPEADRPEPEKRPAFEVQEFQRLSLLE
jgi:elongator complex protein 1